MSNGLFPATHMIWWLSHKHSTRLFVRSSIVFLCAFFSFWVLCFPATWLVGSLPGHEPTAPVFVAANPASITRFSELPLIRFLHCFLGALWTLSAPIQLSPKLRTRRPALHRACGRIFFTGAAAIMAGYLLMERWLVAEHGVHIYTFYRPMACWFTYTAVVAVVSATVQRDFITHGKYCIRHLGAGLTFALARLLVLLVGALLHYLRLMDMRVKDNKLAAFYACSYTSAVLCITGCELLAQQLGNPVHTPKPSQE